MSRFRSRRIGLIHRCLKQSPVFHGFKISDRDHDLGHGLDEKLEAVGDGYPVKVGVDLPNVVLDPGIVRGGGSNLLFLDDGESHGPVIGSKRDIVYLLIEIVRSPKYSMRSIKDALMALFGISLPLSNRSTVVDLGAVPTLFSLVVKDGRGGLWRMRRWLSLRSLDVRRVRQNFVGIRVLVDLLDPGTGSQSDYGERRRSTAKSVEDQHREGER
ncbi:hypothetical protein LINPERHAP2_LOCUS9211 [Linum perenne]